MMKKILCVILAVLMYVTSAPMVFATDIDINIEDVTDQEDTTIPEEEVVPDDEVAEPEEEPTVPDNENAEPDEEPVIPDEEPVIPDEEPTEPEVDATVPEVEPVPPQESKPLQDNDIVADLYVFYDKSDIHGMGHTWIYVENRTNQELKVGIYPLPPNEGVSVGTLPEYDGWGVYYNIEAYQQGIYGMEDQLSMKEEITLKELRRVSNFIVNYLNFWDPVFFNCMLFAFLAWDMGSWKILIPLFFPIIGKVQMLIYPHEIGTLMKPVTKDKVFRQVGMAGWAKLMPYNT